MKKIIFAAVLIALGVAFRSVFHLGENIEFITTATLLAGSYLGGGWTLGIPLAILGITDLMIGNTTIALFTWSAYGVIGLVSWWGFKKFKVKSSKFKVLIRIRNALGMGMVASLWFYLWTNFGVWLLDSWGMYTRDIYGLLESYRMGIPFLRMTIVGNALFIPAAFGLVEFVKRIIILPSVSFFQTVNQRMHA